MRARKKKGQFKKGSATTTATKSISTCTDENNNDPDFSDVNSDPLAQVDENEEYLETFDLFQGKRVFCSGGSFTKRVLSVSYAFGSCSM